ncbi:MAG TPA: phosphoadenosine phosphosulfate reductase family protein [Methanospirillum sp.]|uniref:phosphoadenosine phosphosulfate reductase domain-containing protein n=1 Tax=Methanospirillum sp. TaxID=45200 RepID=UPI002C11B700|nr:phosphoadenosine phosphosulfate reductase family protein [Methanospirillum sp.]HWQ64270.1 phosphoadenosine phosphosulfate reductase family protein [Methanospirillum sp.]
MGGLYHGKILLHWCDNCHAPVMADRCACGAEARSVPVTPPGDARPAFPDDILFINNLFLDRFGITLIPDGWAALVNKVPDKDRMEEVVVGGAIVGAIRYLPETGRWDALPRPESALIQKPEKRYVIVDDGAGPSIREGASLLAPGFVSCDPGIAAGDEVFMLTRSGECVGVGRMKVNADEASAMERGQIVRSRKNIRSQFTPGSATWDEVVEANKDVLIRLESATKQFIEEHIGPYEHLPTSVSYSGGKDSLASLLVVMNTFRKLPILFIDTGMEFPSTYENVRQVTEKYELECIMVDSMGEFWREFEVQGPPAVDCRWCCKTAKLEPLRKFIESTWAECVSFVGQRKYESASRAKNPRVWRNAFVRNQICLAPIHNWTAMHVWLYIFREKAPYNEMYAHGVDRMGCYMCPASDMAILERIQSHVPELWKEWEEKMEAWRVRHELPESWMTEGTWRVRNDRSQEEPESFARHDAQTGRGRRSGRSGK